MKKSITYLIILGAIGILMTGCHKGWMRIDGNGNVVSETRHMPPFNRVVNSGVFNVYVQQDSVSEVTIEAESNLIQSIRTRISGTTLEIDTKDNLNSHYPINLYIRTPDVNGISLNGSGIISANDIVTSQLDVDISGSGDIEVSAEADHVRIGISGSGTGDIQVTTDIIESEITGSGDMYFAGIANTGDFRISGSGTIRAEALQLKECYANISGSGSMYVTVSDLLDVNISGSGSIFYYGNPTVKTNISGSGDVIGL